MKFSRFVAAVVLTVGVPVIASSQTIEVVDASDVIESTTRPSSLIPLYVALATAQALDLHSSHLATSRGGHEMNAALRDLAKRPWLGITIKAGVTTGLIVGAERLWQRNRRKSAVVLIAAITAMQFAVDTHNYRVAAQLR